MPEPRTPERWDQFWRKSTPSDVEVHAMRLRLRTLMIAVAVAAVVLTLVVQIQALVGAEEDFAVPILMLEGIAGSVLLAIGIAVEGMIRFVRKDEAYAAKLRRRDVPARCPFPLNSPSQQEK